MHLSMLHWMRNEPLETTLSRLAKYGYGSIEITGEPQQYTPQEVNALLTDYGLSCWGVVTMMEGGRNLLGRDEDQRARSVRYVIECIDMAAEMGGHEVTITPGAVDKPTPDSTAADEWRWAVDALREICDHAQKHGIRVAIEAICRFESYFCFRGAQALALAKATGPDCGVCLDTFHMNIEEADPYQTIRECGTRLVDFHVADTNRMACGMGRWDWPKVIETLREVGYDGALNLEFCMPVDRTPANPYRGALQEDGVSLQPTEEFYSSLVKKTADTLLPLIS